MLNTSFCFMKKIRVFVALSLLFISNMYAQNLASYNSADIFQGIKKLNVVGSVLFVAAHPDDENTLLLTWLANEKLLKTAYLSINRGDGGQNLIGKEQAEQLGLIRTHELMAARRIDGPEQYFTRATDFGFSKNTEETLNIWNENDILADVVYRIRVQRPDVIICRFPPDQRAGHGNHSASAYLAEKAFKLAGDATKYPEQLGSVEPWQPKRIVWNSFNFGARTQAPIEKDFLTMDIGVYNKITGKSYGEIAAESRSQHKSQGFGVPRDRGTRLEYFVHKDGVKAQKDIFEDIDFTWARVSQAADIKEMTDALVKNYDFQKPEKSVADLVLLYKRLDTVTDKFWKAQKQAEVKKLILQCSGLWLELNPDQQQVAQGDSLKLNFSIINRAEVPIVLDKLALTELQIDRKFGSKALETNKLLRESFSVKVADDKALTQPYWLALPQKHKGQYAYANEQYNGQPMADASFVAQVNLLIGGEPIGFDVPVVYKVTDPVKGELYQPLEVKPKISISPQEKVLVFVNNKPKRVSVILKAFSKNVNGTLQIKAPNGYTISPSSHQFVINKKLDQIKLNFTVTPNVAGGISTGLLIFEAAIANQTYNKEAIQINYDHIPQLSLYQPAQVELISHNIRIKPKAVGYIVGAGDEVPQAIEQLGAKVSYLTEADLDQNLAQYPTIVVGIRAFNISNDLRLKLPQLMRYVENGGNLVVQYQVNSFLQQIADSFGPYPFKISRERVTVEEAEVRFADPSHPILNTPNKISQADFKGWIQERGLYFANEWDAKYQAPLSSNDPGEKPLNGGLLVTNYGKGRFIYTGYAFFRQLPGAVPGAYKLWANLISK
jgi:LmbE family N-acetylglucosaminyl deacetylase